MTIKIEKVNNEKRMKEILENSICYNNTDNIVFNVRIDGQIVTSNKDILRVEFTDL